VVPIYDVGEIDGGSRDHALINGVDLQTLLNAGPLDPKRAVHITSRSPRPAHRHQPGWSTRDVKPSNILLTPNDFAT